MATTHLEIERKYDATAASRLPTWSDLLTGATLSVRDQDLVATYFDTDDLRLLRAGITLRYRTGDDEIGWHLKLPAGRDARDEIRVALGWSEQPPAELLALARSATRGSALRPIAILTTRRRLYRWRDAAAGDLLAVSDDQVSARLLFDERPDQSWREIETELGADGGVALLDRVQSALGGVGVHRACAGSKLARALGPLEPGPGRRRRGSRRTAGDVLLGYLADQAAAIRVQDPRVRRDLPDAVHQMRVATRRLRSTLATYDSLVDPDRTRELRADLKWLGGVLGVARDLEVLREGITAAVAAQPVELVLGPVQARVDRYFAPRQADAHTDVRSALDSSRYLGMLDALVDLVDRPPFRPRAAHPAHPELIDALARASRRVHRRVRAAAAASGRARDLALHETRKAAKQLRYAAEVAEPVLGKATSRLVGRCTDFQDFLGAHQDAVVIAPVLRELGLAARAARENGFTFGLLLGTLSAPAAAPHELASQWRGLSRAAARARKS